MIDLKRRLLDGGTLLGSVLSLPDPMVCETMGAAGFDFLLIDMEHSPVTIAQLEAMLIAARGGDSAFIVRSPWNDPVWVKQILDVGADGVVIPWVNSRAEAEAAVSAARYPPQGRRGIGPRRAARLSGGAAKYVAGANDRILVLPQIEHLDALNALDEILSTPGVDGIMVGPADLAASLGHRDSLDHPDVEQAIEQVLAGCKRHGVPFGMFTGTAEKARKWVRRGGQIATIGSDLGFIDAGLVSTAQVMAELGGG